MKMMKSVLAAMLFSGVSAASCKCGDTDYTSSVDLIMETYDALPAALKDMMPAYCDVCDLQGMMTTLVDPDATCTCDAGCFPATATITLADNKVKQMGQLALGDKVHVGNNQYDDVYLFTTKMEDTMSKFVVLSTKATEAPLKLTTGHYLYVNGKLATAGSVMKGDMLTLANGNKAAVSEVSSEWAPGLYNPHTLNGDIVVDGVLTSTYTDSVDPTLAHALLMPLRQMYSAGTSFGAGFSAMAKGVPSWIRQAVL